MITPQGRLACNIWVRLVERISMPSNPESRLSPRAVWSLAGITLLSVGLYLVFSGVYYHFGFPLDDAWIHQTYARNLASRGEWSFISGHPSGGSTSPLWTALLAIGFWLKLSPYIWAYSLGALALWGLAVLGESAVRWLIPSYRPRFPWIGAVLALEWHLVWAAASGMETLLFALLVTAVLVLVISGSQRYFSLGLLIGLSVWVRPDGVTLLGPAVLGLLLVQPLWQKRLQALVSLGVGFGSLFALYLLFNLMISGSPLPNTFYAKQAEYAAYLKLPGRGGASGSGRDWDHFVAGVGVCTCLRLPPPVLGCVCRCRLVCQLPGALRLAVAGHLSVWALRHACHARLLPARAGWFGGVYFVRWLALAMGCLVFVEPGRGARSSCLLGDWCSSLRAGCGNDR